MISITDAGKLWMLCALADIDSLRYQMVQACLSGTTTNNSATKSSKQLNVAAVSKDFVVSLYENKSEHKSILTNLFLEAGIQHSQACFFHY